MGDYYHDGGLRRMNELNLSRDDRGFWTGVQAYSIRATDFPTLVPANGAPHPVYTYLFVETVEAQELKGGTLFQLNVTYSGGVNLGDEVENPPVYALEVVTSEEPIGTHPRYVDALTTADIQEAIDLARNPPKQEDGTLAAIDTGDWPPLKLELYNKVQGGVEAYRDPKVTWTKQWVTNSLPAGLNDVGEIATPPGSPPAVASGRNWMNVGQRSAFRGGVWENEQVFELSGRGGWDAQLYG